MTAPGVPSREEIDGEVLLKKVHSAFGRYVVFPSAEAHDAVVLWCAATHAQPAWEHAPRLTPTSPEKRCGKSRLMDVAEAVCHQPLITVNASTAAVVRSITEEDPPTLMVDEADTIFAPRRPQRTTRTCAAFSTPATNGTDHMCAGTSQPARATSAQLSLWRCSQRLATCRTRSWTGRL